MLLMRRQWLSSVPQRWSLTPRGLWTLLGGLAVPLWGTWPLLAAMTAGTMPVFQYLALIYASGTVVLFVVPRGATACGLRGGAVVSAMIVGGGLLGSSVLFVSALAFIPVAQANLILYLWPIMVVALCVPLGLARLRVTQGVGILLGLIGASLVIYDGNSVVSWPGIALAAAGGLVWAVSVVFRIWQGPDAPEAMRTGFLLAALVAFCLHLGLEETVVPTLAAFAGAVLAGILPTALGNLLWDHGVRKGDRVMLATFAYATPLVGAVMLVSFGYAVATVGLFAGAVLIVAAGIVASR